MDGIAVAEAANTIARWLGVRDVHALTRVALRCEEGIPEGKADLFVLFGGGVTGSVDVLAGAIQMGVARRYAIVGGRGHSTYWLDQAMERELPTRDDARCTRPRPGIESEAEMLAALLEKRHGLHVDLLETLSTNCGNNITYLFDLLDEVGLQPKSVILCQDATMQRRMDATWRRQAQDREAFARTRLVNWASYRAELTWRDGCLAWAHAPEGIWEVDRYLDLLLGEVVRLSDDERGYGPRGSGFVVHVDVPDEVRQAAELIRASIGQDGRPPDARYAEGLDCHPVSRNPDHENVSDQPSRSERTKDGKPVIYVHLNPEFKGYPGLEKTGYVSTLWMANEYAFTMAGLDRSLWDNAEYWLLGLLMVAQSVEGELVSWGLSGDELALARDDVAASRAMMEGLGLDVLRFKDLLHIELKRDRRARSGAEVRDRCWKDAADRAMARGSEEVWARDLLPILLACPVEPIERALEEYVYAPGGAAF